MYAESAPFGASGSFFAFFFFGSDAAPSPRDFCARGFSPGLRCGVGFDLAAPEGWPSLRGLESSLRRTGGAALGVGPSPSSSAGASPSSDASVSAA